MNPNAGAPNAEQIEYWNGEAGATWSERDGEMDAMLRPLGEAVIDRAGLTAGEKVLDIGCGCGATSALLAERVGPGGCVLGVDISAPMLERAREKLATLPPDTRQVLAFEQADAATFKFAPAHFDLLYSRFGVMFFDDPTAAFANMRTALKPGGRVALLCWGPLEENQWIKVPMGAAMAHLPPPEPVDPRAPGPFAFADADYLTGILDAAGFTGIDLEPFKPTLQFGRNKSVEETAGFFLDIGPTARALAGQADTLRQTVREAIVAAISPHFVDGVLELAGRCWIATARAP